MGRNLWSAAVVSKHRVLKLNSHNAEHYTGMRCSDNSEDNNMLSKYFRKEVAQRQ